MDRIWATVGICMAAVLFSGYLLGFIGYQKDCGQVCQCIGKVEWINKCTGINMSVNQVTALHSMLNKEWEQY